MHAAKVRGKKAMELGGKSGGGAKLIRGRELNERGKGREAERERIEKTRG